jgi:hypothetical protein
MRRPSKPRKIDLSETQYDIWYPKLSEFFKSKNGMSETEVSEKVKGILEEAQAGWPRAPLDIETRIKMKSGYQWVSHNNLRPNADKIPNVMNHREKVKKTIQELFQLENHLSVKEQEWFNQRKREYEEEFEFNKSSDVPLLFQLVVEELTQRRVAGMILSNPQNADTYSKFMTESLKRLQDTQVKLGITREQRSDLLDNRAGDVSSLSVDIDRKIKVAKEKIAAWEKDAQRQKFLRNQEGPLNPLPPIEKIEALLGLDEGGNLGHTLDTKEMDELMKAAERIHDEASEEESEESREVEEEDSGSEEKAPKGTIVYRENYGSSKAD